MMTQLEIDILRSCNYESVQLPYSNEQDIIIARFKREGLVVTVLDDDQPTTVLTTAGKIVLGQAKQLQGQ